MVSSTEHKKSQAPAFCHVLPCFDTDYTTQELFVILIYDCTSEFQGGDAARRYLFSKVKGDRRAGRIWGRQAICFLQVIGLGRSAMDNGELHGQRFLRLSMLISSCSAANAKIPSSLIGLTWSAYHSHACSGIDTELTTRPNTCSRLNYMVRFRGGWSWIQILELHVFCTWGWELLFGIAFLTA